MLLDPDMGGHTGCNTRHGLQTPFFRSFQPLAGWRNGTSIVRTLFSPLGIRSLATGSDHAVLRKNMDDSAP